MLRFVDTHCHLDYIANQIKQSTQQPEEAELALLTPDAVLARAQAEGLQWLVNPSVSLSNIAGVLALAERFDNVFAAVAIHPTDVQELADVQQAQNTAEACWQQLEAWAQHPKVVALGETGLDYYHDTTHAELQKACFRGFLDMGRCLNKPVIIHDREAHDDVAAIVDEFPGVRGVMHCFSGDTTFAETMMAKGFYISFAGNITFKKADMLQEAARNIPLEHLLVETDAPFLSPMPFRGKPNEPVRVRLVLEKIAELRGMAVQELAEITTRNAQTLFGISDSGQQALCF